MIPSAISLLAHVLISNGYKLLNRNGALIHGFDVFKNSQKRVAEFSRRGIFAAESEKSIWKRIECAGNKFKIETMRVAIEIEKLGVHMESVKKIPDFPFRLH